MLDELNAAITTYQAAWHQLIAARKNKAFFEKLQPTAVCFKFASIADIEERLAALREHADHIHWGWINERWLVTVHLRDQQLAEGVQIVKLYQRRPGSTDALGLDHMDFYTPDIDEDILADEPELKWSHESNGEHCSWISIWFDQTEAKLRTHTTFEVCAQELQAVNDTIVEK